MSSAKQLDFPGPGKRTLRSRSLRPVIYVLLAVLAIVVVVGLAVLAYQSGPQAEAPIKSTRTSIGMIKLALNTFWNDHGRFPTNAEGLDALVHQPPDVAEWHPYLEKLPPDAWNQPFVYRCPSTTGQPLYDIYSIGPDGQDGTADDIWDKQ